MNTSTETLAIDDGIGHNARMFIRDALALTLVAAACQSALAQGACTPQHLTGPEGTSRAIHLLALNQKHLVLGDGAAHSLCPGGGDPFSCQAGAVYAFEREGDGWRATQTIVPADIRILDGFGSGLAFDSLDPDRMVVSTSRRAIDDAWGYGHVFEFDGDSWNEVTRFYPPDGPMPIFFGQVSAFRGDTILVQQGGVVHRYREMAGDWSYVESIERPSEVNESGSFGYADLHLSDQWAFVSAHRDSTSGSPSGAPLHGSVLAYRRNPDGSLEYTQRLLPPRRITGEFDSEQFGNDIAFDGHTLVVGAYAATRDFTNQGVAYVFELENDSWVLCQELRNSTPRWRGLFGGGIVISGDNVIVGHVDRDDFPQNSHLFQRDADGVWHEVAIMRPGGAGPIRAKGFGSVAAIHDNVAVLVAPSEDPGGAAYSFDMACVRCLSRIDLDTDGALTIFDFLTFLNLFEDRDSTADFDGDGELTLFDFLAFQGAFGAGCD